MQKAWLDSLKAQKEKWVCAMGCDLPASEFSSEGFPQSFRNMSDTHHASLGQLPGS